MNTMASSTVPNFDTAHALLLLADKERVNRPTVFVRPPEPPLHPGRPSTFLSPTGCYVSVSLIRQSLFVSWGISLSMFDNHILVIGSVDGTKMKNMMKTFWAVDASFADPRFAWTMKGYARQMTFVMGWRPLLVDVSRTLEPGDCILAMNGRAMKEFTTFQDVTRYMRAATSLSLLILRSPAAHAAAKKILDMMGPTEQDERLARSVSFDAAKAAGLCIRNVIWGNCRKQESYPITQQRTLPVPAQWKPPVPTIHHHNEPSSPPLTCYTNPLFRDDDDGQPIPYVDNSEFEPDDGSRANLFLTTIGPDNFHSWLQDRKRTWGKLYQVGEVADVVEDSSLELDHVNRCKSSVPVDFWTHQGFSSFENWLCTSKCLWKRNYSWNQRKRERLAQDCEEVVNVQASFQKWLRVRRNQWRVQRRKRLREHLEQAPHDEAGDDIADRTCNSSPVLFRRGMSIASSNSVLSQPDMLLIDALLEEQERKRTEMRPQLPPPDISFLFDENLGCPDDSIVLIMSYLEPVDYARLLQLSSRTRSGLVKREAVWNSLCPDRWKLPRRPRMPWYELYFKHLRIEKEFSSKKWDDLLLNAASILLKADHLQSIERLVSQAERDYGFHVNYSSGVVCERNSLLNLAVINQRHKVVRWLVETKCADIESCDRGQFTPLLNAAWAGDRYLVRLLMQKGADRAKVGRCHYTKPIAPPDFKGLTADGWAEKMGYHEIALLIRIGL